MKCGTNGQIEGKTHSDHEYPGYSYFYLNGVIGREPLAAPPRKPIFSTMGIHMVGNKMLR